VSYQHASLVIIFFNTCLFLLAFIYRQLDNLTLGILIFGMGVFITGTPIVINLMIARKKLKKSDLSYNM
jgi:hypothetical protein